MSKGEMMSAKDQKKSPLVPRLRFPEFIGDREWGCAQMGDIYAFKKNNSFSRDMLNYNTGNVKNIHYGDIHKKFSSHFYAENENIPFVNCNINLGNISEDCLCTAGDIIFADASEDIKDIGKCIEIISNNKERILSGLHTIFTRQFGSILVIGFGGHLFQSPSVRAQIQKEAQGTKILGISSGRLAKISISFPFAKGEQQKIADCLSSLDERIAAETNKLDTLKDHKKGLLKQLFPAEGETTPELRFPEFRGAGEWGEKTVGDTGEVVTGNTPSTADPENYGGNKLFVSPVDISENRFIYKTKTMVTEQGFKKGRVIPPQSILFVCIGSTIGKIAQNFFECITNQQINSVIPYNSISSNFLYFVLLSYAGNIAGLAGNHAVPIVNKTLFSSFSILLPLIDEQQRIADCLSSLDELITAQTQKIDLLKEHKKGLMQQLFPRIDEALA